MPKGVYGAPNIGGERWRVMVGRIVVQPSLALAYVLIYIRCYVVFLNANFANAGVDLFRRDAWFLTAAVAMAVAPVLAYRGPRAISSVITVLIYLILYVPIIIAFALGSDRSFGEIIRIEVVFFIGMILLFLSDTVIVKWPLDLRLGLDLMPFALGASVLVTLYVLVLYRGSMHFSGFGAELYDQRDANNAIGAGLVTRYLASWQSTVLIPLCLGYGFVWRRKTYVVAAGLGALVMYMAAANKISIMFPFVSFAFYIVGRAGFRRFFTLATVALIAVIGAIILFAPPRGTPLFLATSIFLNRTIGNGGQLAVTYYEFFSYYPRTYYSHVKGFNLLTQYPYGDRQLGQVIGNYYWAADNNANASFWTTDGIAAMGLTGVFLATLACAALFVVMNSITREDRLTFVVLCFLSFVVTLLNSSVFSSFRSGGGFFLLLFFVFNGRRNANGGLGPRRGTFAIA